MKFVGLLKVSYLCKLQGFLRLRLLFVFQGADLVEFDVQLTKDYIPVIYHDFKVLLTYRKVSE